MGSAKRVFLAKDLESNLHVLIEVVEKGDWIPIRGVLDRKDLNALVKWESLGDLIRLIPRFGPLVSASTHRKGYRRMDFRDFANLAEKSIDPELGKGSRFSCCDGLTLAKQLYLDAGKPFFEPLEKCAADIVEFGLFESGAIGDLESLAEEYSGCDVVCEPLCDWVFMRNICSIALRLLAHLRNGEEGVLTSSGFELCSIPKRIWHSAEPGEYYVLPLCHNAIVDMRPSLSLKFLKNGFGFSPEPADPVFALLNCSFERKEKGCSFGRIPDAFTMSAPVVRDRPCPMLARGDYFKTVDVRRYLVFPFGRNENVIADSFVRGLAWEFEGLHDKLGHHIGWEYEKPDQFVDASAPVLPLFHTLAAAMLGTVVLRYDSVPAICRGCGSGMLIRAKGKKKEYCSKKCQSRYMRREGRQ